MPCLVRIIDSKLEIMSTKTKIAPSSSHGESEITFREMIYLETYFILLFILLCPISNGKDVYNKIVMVKLTSQNTITYY